MEQLLIFDEFGAVTVGDLPAEMFVLQQLKEVQTHRILDELGVFRAAPVLKVGEVVAEALVFEEVPLCQKIQIVWIRETLHKLQLNLEPHLLLLFALLYVHGDRTRRLEFPSTLTLIGN